MMPNKYMIEFIVAVQCSVVCERKSIVLSAYSAEDAIVQGKLHLGKFNGRFSISSVRPYPDATPTHEEIWKAGGYVDIINVTE